MQYLRIQSKSISFQKLILEGLIHPLLVVIQLVEQGLARCLDLLNLDFHALYFFPQGAYLPIQVLAHSLQHFEALLLMVPWGKLLVLQVNDFFFLWILVLQCPQSQQIIFFRLLFRFGDLVQKLLVFYPFESVKQFIVFPLDPWILLLLPSQQICLVLFQLFFVLSPFHLPHHGDLVFEGLHFFFFVRLYLFDDFVSFYAHFLLRFIQMPRLFLVFSLEFCQFLLEQVLLFLDFFLNDDLMVF